MGCDLLSSSPRSIALALSLGKRFSNLRAMVSESDRAAAQTIVVVATRQLFDGNSNDAENARAVVRAISISVWIRCLAPIGEYKLALTPGGPFYRRCQRM
jgi:hypothetical protein